MARYLASCMATYRKQALGLGLFLAWNYYSFFSCGLVPVTRIIRSSERVWMWVGLLVALASVVLLLVSARTSLVERRWFGVAAAAFSTAGTVVVWMGFVEAGTYEAPSAVGGMLAGVGFAMMAMVWGHRMSGYNEAAIEFSVPASFIVSFLVYFALLALKGPASFVVDALLPVASMYFAFRSVDWGDEEAVQPCVDGRLMGGKELGFALAAIATLCLLFGMLWFQFSYFRLLSTPNVIGDRFLHYLVPFSCSSVLSIVALVFCLQLSRYLNFTLMFRWGLPLLLLGYVLLFRDYDDPVQRIVAYTANFIGMFGVQFTLWIATPKYVRCSGLPSSVLFGGLMAAEGVGIYLGTWYGLSVIDGVTAANVMSETLLFFVGVLLVAMVVGFNPRWSFFRTKGRWASGETGDAGGKNGGAYAASAADDIAHLFVKQAGELQRRYGLSSRETEVAALLLAGRSRPYIRDELVISLNTVHSHVSNIYAKCGVHSQREFMDLLAAPREGAAGARRDEVEG